MRSAVTLHREYVGKKALLTVLDSAENKVNQTRGTPGLEVPVIIQDAAVRYGREDLLVTPYCGVGSAWCGASRCTIVEEWPDEAIQIQRPATPGSDEPPELNPDSVEPSA